MPRSTGCAVLLWCPRDVAWERLAARGSRDADDRIRAWDETRAELLEEPEFAFDVAIRTDRSPVDGSAAAIHVAVARECPGRRPVAVRTFLASTR
ncbi:MAG TPA: hypothetical protein VGD72_06760 [Mycobacteriales bacterium]|jgi:guanylate kinase